MAAPEMAPAGVKKMRTNLPNRDELWFLTVWALPNASRIGLASRICCSRRPSRGAAPDPAPAPAAMPLVAPDEAAAACRAATRSTDSLLLTPCAPEPEPDAVRGSAALAARYWMTFLVFSVLPAPDSPVTRTLCDWWPRWSTRLSHARSATAKTCGGWAARRGAL